jgi:hypothetical protein
VLSSPFLHSIISFRFVTRLLNGSRQKLMYSYREVVPSSSRFFTDSTFVRTYVSCSTMMMCCYCCRRQRKMQKINRRPTASSYYYSLRIKRFLRRPIHSNNQSSELLFLLLYVAEVASSTRITYICSLTVFSPFPSSCRPALGGAPR